MNVQQNCDKSPSRRDFLKRSGGALTGAALTGAALTGTALTGTALTSAISARAYAGEDNTIKIALVGCGGRGTGAAANALSTKGPKKLVAMADVFDNRVEGSLKRLSGQFADDVDVPPDRRFVGLDAFKKAIDLLDEGDVVLLTTPPMFRPMHLEYAVEKGRHVFMEKSFAVDAPGIRRVLKAGQAAEKKNLKIAGGLMSRHYKALQEAVRQIHDGVIGDVITCWAYREHGPVGFRPKPQGMSELAHQISNYSCFTWINGSFLLDWLIHNIDVCCWVKDAWPISAQGQGGREVRKQADQMFDHFAVEYTFPDRTRLLAQGRHMAGCWGFFGNVIHGSKGSAVLGEGIRDPRIYDVHVSCKDYQQKTKKPIWEYSGSATGGHQVEHDVLFEAIRQDKPHNETERSAKAAMTGILGRMAAESGKEITWEEAIASDVELAPGLEKITSLDDPAPVMPDENGNYPVAVPGFAKVL